MIGMQCHSVQKLYSSAIARLQIFEYLAGIQVATVFVTSHTYCIN